MKEKWNGMTRGQKIGAVVAMVLVIVVVLLLLLVPGCRQDDEVEAAGTPEPAATAEPTGSPAVTATPKPTATPSPKPTATPEPTPEPMEFTISGYDTVTAGKGTQLVAVDAEGNGLDGESLAWQSSDESIAVVTNGWVDALAEGKVTITATAVDGGTASHELTVQPKPAVQTTQQTGTAQQPAAPSSDPVQEATPAAPDPAPATEPDPAPEEPQHYHGNGSDWGTCPVCGLAYSPVVPGSPIDDGYDPDLGTNPDDPYYG